MASHMIQSLLHRKNSIQNLCIKITRHNHFNWTLSYEQFYFCLYSGISSHSRIFHSYGDVAMTMQWRAANLDLFAALMSIEGRRGGVVVERSLRMQEIGVRYSVETDLLHSKQVMTVPLSNAWQQVWVSRIVIRRWPLKRVGPCHSRCSTL